MIAGLLILLPVAGVATWVFLRFPPARADRRAVLRFNLLSLAVACAGTAVWIVRTYVLMSPTVDSAWWPVVSALGALVIVPVVLALAAILRAFLLSSPRRA